MSKPERRLWADVPEEERHRIYTSAAPKHGCPWAVYEGFGEWSPCYAHPVKGQEACYHHGGIRNLPFDRRWMVSPRV